MNSPAHVERLCARISDPGQVAKSRQLPFRFLAAYNEIRLGPNPLTGQVIEALEKAVLCSADNICGFDSDTNVLLACDVSGSMYMPAGKRSSIQNVDIGILLASILRTKCKAVVSGIFGDTWELVPNHTGGVLANTVGVSDIAGRVGYSTNGYKVIDWLSANKVKMDKVMFFTDCQMWDSSSGYYSRRKNDIMASWRKYKAMCPQAKLYLFDLAGYGLFPLDLAGQDVYLIAGWNEKVFEILGAVDNGADALYEIRKISL